MKYSLPSQEELKREFNYNTLSGYLSWALPGRKRVVGRPLYTFNCNGYLVVGYKHINYLTHRIIWKWMTGEEPNEIDHINHIKDDNHWENLRDVSKSSNALNMKERAGRELPKGVSFDKGKYAARIRIEKRNIHLGNFSTVQEALIAYTAASKAHFEAVK